LRFFLDIIHTAGTMCICGTLSPPPKREIIEKINANITNPKRK